MLCTFVPGEALTHASQISFGPETLRRRDQSSPTSFVPAEPAYNLFRHRSEAELYCAVPDGWPVPTFIQSEQWIPGGKLDETTPAPIGFDPEAARIGARLNGFYLFIAFAWTVENKLPRPDRLS